MFWSLWTICIATPINPPPLPSHTPQTCLNPQVSGQVVDCFYVCVAPGRRGIHENNNFSSSRIKSLGH